jgi:small ligand-binding sensory domain FIST
MKWASAIAQHSTIETCFQQAAEQIIEELGSEKPDLLLCFIAQNFSPKFGNIPELAAKYLSPKTFAGCSAGGIIGGGIELEKDSCIALSAATLPDVKIHKVHIEDADLPDLDAAPNKWEEMIGVSQSEDPQFILLPDPFSFRIDVLTQGLDYAFPRSVKIGGLASGANAPAKGEKFLDGNALFLDDKVFRSGALSLALSGNVAVDSIVAQGCRPIGPTFRVSKCHNKVLLELDGKPAVQALYDVLAQMTAKEQELAKFSLFLGVVMDEFKDSFRPGDFLIRNIIGLEPNSGALLVGEILRNERTVQFHLRDAETSSDDLRALLKQYKDNASEKPQGALLFSCLGRGEHLYGVPNHDSDCFRDYLGAIPLAGFFCNGEIGPVGGTTFLHGYTSSFGLFRPRSNSEEKSE